MKLIDTWKRMRAEDRAAHLQNIRVVKELRDRLLRLVSKWGTLTVVVGVGIAAAGAFVATAQYILEVFAIRNWELTWYWTMVLLVTAAIAHTCYRYLREVTKKGAQK